MKEFVITHDNLLFRKGENDNRLLFLIKGEVELFITLDSENKCT